MAYPQEQDRLERGETAEGSIRAQIGFLRRSDDFEETEPYAFRYKADVPCPLTNMQTEFQEVLIHDMRGREHETTLETCGFEFRTLRSSTSYEQFDNDEDFKQVFCKDIKQQLLVDYNAIEADFVRVRIRRRDPSFPKSIGKPFQYSQPSTAAHIDITSESAVEKIKFHRKQVAEEYLRRPYKIVNVWKPLSGPLLDWPLAVCDARTVDESVDIAEATILHQDYINHNCQIHHGVTQKWCYLSKQQANELLIFRQYDSELAGNNGVPHSAFDHPLTPQRAPLRESIEIMAILYF